MAAAIPIPTLTSSNPGPNFKPMALSAQRPGVAAREVLLKYHSRLLEQLGPQAWWPARTRLEVVLGAVLTQNTTWRNAARALGRLRKVGRLGLSRLQLTDQANLESLIRPAGFFRQKARTIRGFLGYLKSHHRGSLARMFARPVADLRHDLLSLKGLGPETVDAILLYAGRHPFFVADAYTRRILARHELVPPDASYAEVQQFLHQNLPANYLLFNEYHALLVEVGKRYCRTQRPRCEACPLQPYLPVTWNPGVAASKPGASQASVDRASSVGALIPEVRNRCKVAESTPMFRG